VLQVIAGSERYKLQLLVRQRAEQVQTHTWACPTFGTVAEEAQGHLLCCCKVKS
jgi:hypothetical protein